MSQEKPLRLDDDEIESILKTVKAMKHSEIQAKPQKAKLPWQFYEFGKGTPIIQEGRLGTTCQGGILSSQEKPWHFTSFDQLRGKLIKE